MITKETVARLATLSRLRFSEAETTQYARDLDAIFEHAKSLNTLPTDDIEPSAHAMPIENIFRSDSVAPFESDAILQNAPEQEGHAFVVPRILT